jgi:RNA polymerase-binding transcription factor DksA
MAKTLPLKNKKLVAKAPAPKKGPASKAVVTKKPAAKPAPSKIAAKPAANKKAPAKPIAKASTQTKKKPAPAKPIAKVSMQSKKTAPAKPAPKATPAKKVVAAAKAPVKNTAPAKKVAAPVKQVKQIPPVKKQAEKPLAKAEPASKAPAKKVASVKTQQLGKTVMSSLKKVVNRVVEHIIPSNKPIVAHRAVIVPSKPAINPKPLPVSKKPEVAKSNKPVVIPKTSTNNKVDYNPEFKSVLDKPAHVPSGPTMRYSDGELKEFRELISKKLDAAKKELAYLQGLITRKDEMGGDESDNRYMTMEDGSMSMEREQLSQMASRQITFIDHLEKSVMRIENKTYGICRVTGKLIDKARLRAVPHATLSMEAKLGIVK